MLIRGVDIQTRTPSGRPLSMCCYAAAALEALLSFAEFAVSLIGLVCLHPVTLICFVTSDNAAGRRSQNTVVTSKTRRAATDGSTLQTALSLRRRNCCQSKNNSCASDKCFQFSLHTFVSR